MLLKPFKIIKDEIILKKETTIFKPTIIFKDNIASINLLTLNKAQIKEKQIKHLFKEDKWAQYFNSNIEELRFKIISKLINSDSPLPLIKLNLRLN